MKKKVLFLFLSILSLNGFSQEGPSGFSIKDCIEYARNNNGTIKMSRYDEEIARQQVKETRGRALPQANINAVYEDKLMVPQLIIPGMDGFPGMEGGGGGIPMGFQYNSMVSGEVTQAIIDPSLSAGLKAAKASGKYYQQNSLQVNERVIYNIASSYYNVIVVEKQLDLLKVNLFNTESTLNNTEKLFSNGVAKQVDVNRLRVSVSNLQSQIKQSEMNLDRAYNNLKFQMGMPLDAPLVLTEKDISFDQDEAVLRDLDPDFFENRTDFKMLQTNLELLDLERRSNIAGYFPRLTAFANFGHQAQGAEFGLFRTQSNGWVDFNTASIGLRLHIPVFDGLQKSAKVQQSKLKMKQLEENINMTKHKIDLEVSNALTQYKSTLRRIEAEKENVKLAEEVYAVTQLEFKEGVGSSHNVVESETSLRQAQNTYVSTLLNLYIARLDLEQSKGTLQEYLNVK